jgi:hypothetical protein
MPETRFLKETGFLSTLPRMKTALRLQLLQFRANVTDNYFSGA